MGAIILVKQYIMHGNPMLIWVAICLSNFLWVRACSRQCEALFVGVLVMERESSHEMRNYVFSRCLVYVNELSYRHITDEVFIETYGPMFRGLQRSGNHSILT